MLYYWLRVLFLITNFMRRVASRPTPRGPLTCEAEDSRTTDFTTQSGNLYLFDIENMQGRLN